MSTLPYYVQRLHPIPPNLSGLGDPIADGITSMVQPLMRGAVVAGVNDAWPTIETNTRAMLDSYSIVKYEKSLLAGIILVGGLAAIASIITIKHELGK
jgi:hypothetical protein